VPAADVSLCFAGSQPASNALFAAWLPATAGVSRLQEVEGSKEAQQEEIPVDQPLVSVGTFLIGFAFRTKSIIA